MSDPTERNRRVTDKMIPFDVAAQALEIADVRAKHDLLQQRVSSGMENVTNSLASVQTELRIMSGRLGELTGLTHTHDSNREAIDKVATSVAELGQRFEGWFDDSTKELQERWQRHDQDAEKTARDLARETRMVREMVIRFIGIGTGIGLLLGTVAGMSLYILNYRFNEGVTAATSNAAAQVRNTEKLHDIELYLARGGRVPEEAYVPSNQQGAVRGNQFQARK